MVFYLLNLFSTNLRGVYGGGGQHPVKGSQAWSAIGSSGRGSPLGTVMAKKDSGIGISVPPPYFLFLDVNWEVICFKQMPATLRSKRALHLNKYNSNKIKQISRLFLGGGDFGLFVVVKGPLLVSTPISTENNQV